MANFQDYQGRGRRDQFGKKDDLGVRINHHIRAQQIRLIGSDGSAIGIVSLAEGISRAEQEGLDLVEVSPNAEPPVCKILDFGKFRYEAQKKAKAAKKNQKVVHLKEIKIRPGIEQHDYEVKLRSAKGFIADGDKVKFTLRFRGREMSHVEIGMELLKKIVTDLSEVAKVEVEPNMEGKQAIMVLVPK